MRRVSIAAVSFLVLVWSVCSVTKARANRHYLTMAGEGTAFRGQLRGDLQALPANQRDAIQEYINLSSAPRRRGNAHIKGQEETTGIGSGHQNFMICAFCRRHNFVECIQRFCNDASNSRLSSNSLHDSRQDSR